MPRTNVDMTGRYIRRFNDWLRGEMKRKKVNQTVLAEYLHIAQQTLSLRMCGVSEWPFRDVLEVCEYFGTDLANII